MQTALNSNSESHASYLAQNGTDSESHAHVSALQQYQIIRRNGAVVPFEPNKIAIAMMKAFLAVHGTQGAASASVREMVDGLTQAWTIKSGASVAKINLGAPRGGAKLPQPLPSGVAPSSNCMAGALLPSADLKVSCTNSGSSKATAMPAKVPSL